MPIKKIKCQSPDAHFGNCEIMKKDGQYYKNGVGVANTLVTYVRKGENGEEYMYPMCSQCAREHDMDFDYEFEYVRKEALTQKHIERFTDQETDY